MVASLMFACAPHGCPRDVLAASSTSRDAGRRAGSPSGFFVAGAPTAGGTLVSMALGDLASSLRPRQVLGLVYVIYGVSLGRLRASGAVVGL